ncbi:MAG: hypothetical protein O7G85_08425 [Planctomycetota bacterium]|nr:hypothetical protein [Planctomycetota bacterium]
MNLAGRLQKLERMHAFHLQDAIDNNPEARARLDRLFEITENRNGPPPRNQDGTLDIEALPAWIDQC